MLAIRSQSLADTLVITARQSAVCAMKLGACSIRLNSDLQEMAVAQHSSSNDRGKSQEIEAGGLQIAWYLLGLPRRQPFRSAEWDDHRSSSAQSAQPRLSRSCSGLPLQQ